MTEQFNLSEWYNPTEAAERLSKNSGKTVDISYVRTLARYGKIKTVDIGTGSKLYWKQDIDNYVVSPQRGPKPRHAKEAA